MVFLFPYKLKVVNKLLSFCHDDMSKCYLHVNMCQCIVSNSNIVCMPKKAIIA